MIASNTANYRCEQSPTAGEALFCNWFRIYGVDNTQTGEGREKNSQAEAGIDTTLGEAINPSVVPLNLPIPTN
jgi:hypothetical protein